MSTFLSIVEIISKCSFGICCNFIRQLFSALQITILDSVWMFAIAITLSHLYSICEGQHSCGHGVDFNYRQAGHTAPLQCDGFVLLCIEASLWKCRAVLRFCGKKSRMVEEASCVISWLTGYQALHFSSTFFESDYVELINNMEIT